MTEEQSSAIEQFFAAANRLKSLNIVRSDKYLGDIAEFICKDQFGIELAKSGRQSGYDGHIRNQRVQIKYGGGTSTTVDCGNPEQYEELIILLGPRSVLRSKQAQSGFVVYRIPSDAVKAKAPHSDGKRRYSIGQLPTECLVGSRK